MDILNKFSVTDAGRLSLTEDEVELKYESTVSVESPEGNVILENGALVLTNFRLVHILTKTNVQCVGLHLEEVTKVDDHSSIFALRKKLRIEASKRLYYVNFGGGGKAEFQRLLMSAMDRKSWLSTKAKSTNFPVASSNIVVPSGGLTGIRRRQQQEIKTVEEITKKSFDDIDSLMKHARELVEVSKRYSAYRQRRTESRVDHSETESESDETLQIDSVFRNLGIITPVTANSAGKLYHEQLARQIADMLLTNQRLERLGGIATLHDIFCLYNKARGTELVSPDDLLSACRKMQSLHLGIRLVTFPSGVVTLQLDSINEKEMCGQVSAMAIETYRSTGDGIDSSFVSSSLRMSFILAKELLLKCEELELLCRDDSVRGVFFFPNRFPDFSP